jgi:hypothetical protein
MKIDIQIDKLTPCLVEVATGNVLQTTFSVAENYEIQGLQEKGWSFDWANEELKYCNIYKLQLKDDDVIQGLVAAEVLRGAVYIALGESAPHNQPQNKKYEGVGGHLFAIAIKLSLTMGFGGYVFFDAKNQALADHYTKSFGAQHLLTRIHNYRMEIFEENAQKLIEKYTLEGDLNVR